MNSNLIRLGFIASGLINIFGVLLFSKCFTSTVISEADPVVMSNFGLLMIMVWGLVFLATADIYQNAKWLVGAFVVEKLVYVIAWLKWISTNSLSAVFEKDFLAGAFYSIYGINDLLFFIFFLMVFYRCGNVKM